MKAYIKPMIKVADMEAETLLAGSVTKGLDGVTTSDGDFAGGDGDSRRKSVWDDEE